MLHIFKRTLQLLYCYKKKKKANKCINKLQFLSHVSHEVAPSHDELKIAPILLKPDSIESVIWQMNLNDAQEPYKHIVDIDYKLSANLIRAIYADKQVEYYPRRSERLALIIIKSLINNETVAQLRNRVHCHWTNSPFRNGYPDKISIFSDNDPDKITKELIIKYGNKSNRILYITDVKDWFFKKHQCNVGKATEEICNNSLGNFHKQSILYLCILNPKNKRDKSLIIKNYLELDSNDYYARQEIDKCLDVSDTKLWKTVRSNGYRIFKEAIDFEDNVNIYLNDANFINDFNTIIKSNDGQLQIEDSELNRIIYQFFTCVRKKLSKLSVNEEIDISHCQLLILNIMAAIIRNESIEYIRNYTCDYWRNYFNKEDQRLPDRLFLCKIYGYIAKTPLSIMKIKEWFVHKQNHNFGAINRNIKSINGCINGMNITNLKRTLVTRPELIPRAFFLLIIIKNISLRTTQIIGLVDKLNIKYELNIKMKNIEEEIIKCLQRGTRYNWFELASIVNPFITNAKILN